MTEDSSPSVAESPLQSARGMHDILPERSAGYVRVENSAREIFSLFGYQELRTPVLEPLALFQRAIGEHTDIVEKEMFTLKDRGERLLCLRPEGTAGTVRALIENNLAQSIPLLKLFYCGQMFRAERPQKGRYREFVQVGSEYFGNAAPAADAETILLASSILKKAGAGKLEIRLNSIGCSACRPKYLEALGNYLKGQSAHVCPHCKSRMEKNPLRVLDCKEDSSKFDGAPKTRDHLCAECASHFDQVQALLKAGGAEFVLFPKLVRGLDYYSRTVFEIYPADLTGSQDALAAGGRYDTLVQDLGGEPTPAVGFALGVERLLNLAQERAGTPETQKRIKKVFVAALGAESVPPAFEVLNRLRAAGVPAEGTLNGQSLKSQIRLADRLNVRFCAILGSDEIKENCVMLKDLEKQSQKKVPLDSLVDTIHADA